MSLLEILKALKSFCTQKYFCHFRATYKFRVAAVYSNNDNKHGPNSDRFDNVIVARLVRTCVSFNKYMYQNGNRAADQC